MTHGNELSYYVDYSLPVTESNELVQPLAQREGCNQTKALSKQTISNYQGSSYVSETGHAPLHTAGIGDSTQNSTSGAPHNTSSPRTVTELKDSYQCCPRDGLNTGDRYTNTSKRHSSVLTTYSENKTDHGNVSPTHQSSTEVFFHTALTKNPGTVNDRTVNEVPPKDGTASISMTSHTIADPGAKASSENISTPDCQFKNVLINPSVPHCSIRPSFDPVAIKEHGDRIKSFWPTPSDHAKRVFPDFCKLYCDIKDWCCPNALGARITIESGLNLEQWESRLTDHDSLIIMTSRFAPSYVLGGRSGILPPTLQRQFHTIILRGGRTNNTSLTLSVLKLL